MKGRTPKTNYRPVARSLTEIEEDVIVQHILDQSRGFPPAIEGLREMADYILASRGSQRVRKQWPYRFIKRREELRTRFPGAYDIRSLRRS